ncbi:MAG TPA: hypothetical protein VGL36_35645 [Kribbella sp.]
MPTMEKAELRTPRGEILHAAYQDDSQDGTTTYRISGQDVRGVFVIDPQVVDHRFRVDPDLQLVRIYYGQDARQGSAANRDRLEKPIVDGCELEGAPLISLDWLRRYPLSGWTPAAVANSLIEKHYRGGTDYEVAPVGVTDHAADVVEALLRHWCARPESYALRLHKAQTMSRRRKSTLHTNMRAAVDQFAEARSDLLALELEIAAVNAFDSVDLVASW